VSFRAHGVDAVLLEQTCITSPEALHAMAEALNQSRPSSAVPTIRSGPLVRRLVTKRIIPRLPLRSAWETVRWAC